MTEKDFIFEGYSTDIKQGEVSWSAPSNIALVKYWGKRGEQLPANPSLSFTLKNCRTTTHLRYRKKAGASAGFDFELYFEGEKKESFRPKIAQFFERISPYASFLKDFSLEIRTANTFPHSSGIASSASGMAALALCVMGMERELTPSMDRDYFFRKASFLARLGSGSACRSIEGPVVVWGENEALEQSSDLYGLVFPEKLHPNFRNYQDTILLVDKGQKKVSSTLGHGLMKGHPYAEKRFAQAHRNMERLRGILKSGDLEAFVKLVESEALTLHGMMMTSMPYFLLMRPNTLEIIERIFEFRQRTGSNVCFTLDAGANVHVLYPEAEKEAVMSFIESELQGFCEQGQFICDEMGSGAASGPSI